MSSNVVALQYSWTKEEDLLMPIGQAIQMKRSTIAQVLKHKNDAQSRVLYLIRSWALLDFNATNKYQYHITS